VSDGEGIYYSRQLPNNNTVSLPARQVFSETAGTVQAHASETLPDPTMDVIVGRRVGRGCR